MASAPALKAAAPRLHTHRLLSRLCIPLRLKVSILPLPTYSSLPTAVLSLRKLAPLAPLVARTSVWALQQESETVEAEGEEGYPEPPEEARIFVGNLPYDMDSESLTKLFEQAGIVEISKVIYNRDGGQNRGFGFVTMSTVEEAEKAVEMFHQYDCNGRLLTVDKAAPREPRPEKLPREFEPTREFKPTYRIYAGNLPWQVDDSRLEHIFSEHGKVVDARVVYDRETGRSRGFGFVSMSSQTEQDDAIAALDGQSLDGRTLRVNVAEQRLRRASF